MGSESKTLLIVGAGAEQVPIIDVAMNRGYRVIALDGNPRAPGLKRAAISKVVSTRDIEGVLEVAREYAADGITYMITESPMVAIRHAACALGLPAPSEKSVEATVSKARMREIFENYGITNPKFICLKSLEQAVEAGRNIGYPLVVKPADSSGQIGVRLLSTPSQLAAAFREAADLSPSKEVIMEEWLDGPELNAVGIVLGGQIHSLVISDREKHPTEAFGVVIRHVYPSNLDAAQRKQVKELCGQVVKVLEIDNGIIFPQVILTTSGPVMVEFGERVPGGIMKELFEFATGYDLLNLQIDIALGELKPLEKYKTIPCHDAVVVKFLNGQPGPLKMGRVSQVIGMDKILKIDGILAADFFLKGNEVQEIKPLRRSANRFFYIVAGGNTRDETCILADEAARVLDFIDEFGQSLVDGK